MTRLSDKVALITGGSRGIGRATAERFVAEGAAVGIVDVNDEAGEALAAELRERDGKAIYIHADVSDREQAGAAVARLKDEFGRLDILVNNAGIVRDAQLLKMTEQQFDAVIAVNLKGTFNCTQAAAPLMIEQGSGRIINVSSVVALYGNFGQTNYVATKAGVIGMTKTWARELGRKGINVNAVAPGFIATEMVEAIPEKVVDQMKAKIPCGRLGAPDELAKVYTFLASDEASYVNGAVISVDGGMTI